MDLNNPLYDIFYNLTHTQITPLGKDAIFLTHLCLMGKNIPSHGTLDSIIQRFVRQFNMADENYETSHPVHGKMTDFRADAFYSQRLGKTVWTERKTPKMKPRDAFL